jgi:hypothetical protein
VSINDDFSYYAYILIHTVSFEPRPTMEVNICNLCSDIRLIDGRDFSNYMSWNKCYTREVNGGGIMDATLTSLWASFEGYLAYQLQKETVKSDDRLESTSTLLFIAWKSEGYKELRACIRMVERSKQMKWDAYKLREYYQRYANQFSTYTDYTEDTWLMRDGTVLMTRLELDFTQRNNILSITISKSTKDDHTKRTVWISPKM